MCKFINHTPQSINRHLFTSWKTHTKKWHHFYSIRHQTCNKITKIICNARGKWKYQQQCQRGESSVQILIRRASLWSFSSKKVAFSIKPVTAVHMARNRRTLPPVTCHGTAMTLVSNEALGNTNIVNPNNHYK